MLITKKYIRMCKRAKQLQELWKPKVGDWIYFTKLDRIFLITIVKKDIVEYIDPTTKEDSWCYKKNIKIYFIWLPTQEKLIELIKEKYYKLTIEHYDTPREVLKSKITFSDAYYKPLIEFFEYDYKIIWLKIIMKYKYNKTWNRKTWVKK